MSLSPPLQCIVVVGASLAGISVAQEVRRLGFDGRLTIIGDEPLLPYDRPPLTKGVLTGRLAADQTQLPVDDQLDVEWVLGVAATALDRNARGRARRRTPDTIRPTNDQHGDGGSSLAADGRGAAPEC